MILLIISYLFKNMNLDNFDNYKFSDKLSIQNINNLKKSQIKMTDMLREFNRICRKYNLKYWCDWGTLLGTIRYNKWIPYDSDIDVSMFKEDYDILKNIVQKELPKTMWFQDKNTDKYYKSDIGKIRYINSCYVDT